MDNKTVTMAHGAGGRQTSELIDEVFKAHFANPVGLQGIWKSLYPAASGRSLYGIQ